MNLQRTSGFTEGRRFPFSEQETTSWGLVLTSALFCVLFPIDSISYASRSFLSLPVIPLGFGASIATLLLLPPILRFPGVFQKIVLSLLAIFLMSAALSAYASPFFDWDWATLFIQYIANFLLGISLRQIPPLSPRMVNFAWVMTLLFAIFIAGVLQNGWTTEDNFNYLRVGNGLFYWSLWVFFLPIGKIQRTILFLAVATSLFIINSRTYFFLWITLPPLYIAIGSTRRLTNMLALVGISAIVLLLYFQYWDVLIESLGNYNSRMVKLLTAYETDTSLNARREMFSLGVQQIRSYWFYGFYNGFLEYGGQGSYIHNILSYWHQFGLIPFVCLLSILALATLKSFSELGRDPQANFSVATLVLIITSALLAQSYQATGLFFAIGIAIGYPIKHKEKSRRFY